MNIKLIKKINFKIVGLSMAVAVLAIFTLWSHFKSASGAQGDPEAQMQELSGTERVSFSIGETGYLNLRAYSERVGSINGTKIKYFLRLPAQAHFETLYSAIDKGGRSRSVTLDEITSGYYRVSTNKKLPDSYWCKSGEQVCIDNATLRDNGLYYVEDNYLDVKLRVKVETVGSYDLTSNYLGCESGPLKLVGQDSRVEYFDPTSDAKYKTLYLKSVCVRVAESAPRIIKTSYSTDPGDDLTNPTGTRQAGFDAGDDVWIVLEVNDSTSGRTDYIVEDTLPSSVSGVIDYNYYQGSNKVSTGKVTVSESKIKFYGYDIGDGEITGALVSGKNYIKYKYKI